MAHKWNSLTGGMIQVRWNESDLWMARQEQILAKVRKESKMRKMRKLLKLTFLIVALVLTVAPVATLTTGCKTSQQTAVYKTLASVESSVDSAFKAYLDQVVKGKIPSTSVHGISQDYAIFQTMMTASVTAAQGNTAAIASQELINAGAQILNKIIAAKGGK